MTLWKLVIGSGLFLAACATVPEATHTEEPPIEDAGSAAFSMSNEPTQTVEIWEEDYPVFKENGVEYVVIDGDILVEVDDAEKFFEEREEALVALQKDVERTGDQPEKQLLLATYNGMPSVWPRTISELTYSIDQGSFSDLEFQIISAAMNEAAADWNNVCGNCRVRFVRLPDGSTDALFVVRKTFSNQFLAAAFFPHSPPYQRSIRVSQSYFMQTQFSHAGIMRHELGHVLGYRHEQIRRPDLRQCNYEDGNWYPLTPPDLVSTMHYLCDFGGTNELRLSNFDIVGHRRVYSQ